jgi:hypothetical protein
VVPVRRHHASLIRIDARNGGRDSEIQAGDNMTPKQREILTKLAGRYRGSRFSDEVAAALDAALADSRRLEWVMDKAPFISAGPDEPFVWTREQIDEAMSKEQTP